MPSWLTVVRLLAYWPNVTRAEDTVVFSLCTKVVVGLAGAGVLVVDGMVDVLPGTAKVSKLAALTWAGAGAAAMA
jgi:hypothetical protein